MQRQDAQMAAPIINSIFVYFPAMFEIRVRLDWIIKLIKISWWTKHKNQISNKKRRKKRQ